MTTDQLVLPTFTVEDVRAVTDQVWEACLHHHGDFLQWGTGEPLEGEVTQALIRIVGEWSGAITLDIESGTARTAAEVMLQVEDVEPEEVTDAVGELVNIIGGNIKSLLPTPSKLSLPQVSRRLGSGDPTVEATVDLGYGVGSATEVCRVDLSWGARPILVRVWS